MLAGKLFAGQVLLAPERFVELVPEVTTTIGPFSITGFSVDHSIYGCMAFLIEADGKRMLYSRRLTNARTEAWDASAADTVP